MPHCVKSHALAQFFIPSLPDCGTLEAPCNGQVVMTTSTVNSTATYTCEVGFALDVDVTRTCQSNGEWSGSAPCCEIGKILFVLILKVQVIIFQSCPEDNPSSRVEIVNNMSCCRK